MKLIVLLTSCVLLLSIKDLNNTIELKAEIKNRLVKNYKDLSMKVTLINHQLKTLIILNPKSLDWGYDFDPEAQVYFEVEKYERSKFKKSMECANIDRMPMYDSTGT